MPWANPTPLPADVMNAVIVDIVLSAPKLLPQRPELFAWPARLACFSIARAKGSAIR